MHVHLRALEVDQLPIEPDLVGFQIHRHGSLRRSQGWEGERGGPRNGA
jgi:hypothetical protein